MMFRRRAGLALGVAVALTMPTLGACSKSAKPAADAYDLITPGVITAGILQEQPPFAYGGADGKPLGFGIDLTNEVAKRLDLKVEYKTTDIQGLLAGFPAGRYDLGVAGLSATAARKENVDFIKPIYWSYTGVLGNKDSTARSLSDFAGKSVGVLAGSVQETFAVNKMPGAKIVKFPTTPLQVASMVSGGIDYLVLSSSDAKVYLAKYPEWKLAVKEDQPDPTSFPLKKGNTAFGDAFNTKIDEMISDGTFIKIYEKYFLTEPMNPKLVEFRPGLGRYVSPPPSPSK